MSDSISAEEYNAMRAGPTKRPKYNNEPIVIDGRRFDSIAEGTRYWELKRLEDAGEISDLECQVEFPLTVQGETIGEYRCDFRYRDSSGELVIEDVKGKRTDMYLWKRKHMKAQYGIEIKEIDA